MMLNPEIRESYDAEKAKAYETLNGYRDAYERKFQTISISLLRDISFFPQFLWPSPMGPMRGAFSASYLQKAIVRLRRLPSGKRSWMLVHKRETYCFGAFSRKSNGAMISICKNRSGGFMLESQFKNFGTQRIKSMTETLNPSSLACIELLEQVLTDARAGSINTVGIVACGPSDFGAQIAGSDARSVALGLDVLKAKIVLQ